MTMKTQNEKQDTATPAAFTLDALTTAGNNLTRGMVAAAQQMLRLQNSMLHSVVAMGFILGEARKLHFKNFTKLFPKKQGDEIKSGMFACSYNTANNYIKTATAIWQRAAAAGREQALEQQVRAYIVDAQTFDAPQREIPVLAELINTEWVSMHQVMLELGVIKQGHHRQLANNEPAEQTISKELADIEKNAWENTTNTLKTFRFLMETDIPRLNLQQRHTLRDELQRILTELDRLETAAPALGVGVPSGNS